MDQGFAVAEQASPQAPKRLSFTDRSAGSLNRLVSVLIRTQSLVATACGEPCNPETSASIDFHCLAEALDRAPNLTAEIAEAIHSKLNELEELLF